ncbi:hypothetical protein [Pseudomonas sp. MWU16-30322]|uniref:hypothetical protein n=1 Tax=Pseudomonas sp. MWU16-30322 TaxID=2878092 RepID=UPI001CFA875A|nr:hypothetical protein [Pseudomonas sp. MWU16-30322]
MKKPKYGPSFWSAPATAGVYKYFLLPLFILMPLLALWMQGHLSQENAVLSCFISSSFYACLPFTTALKRDQFLNEYRGYRSAIEARLRHSDVSPKEERYLLRKLVKLESQYHLVLNPTPAMQLANTLAIVATHLARTIARY